MSSSALALFDCKSQRITEQLGVPPTVQFMLTAVTLKSKSDHTGDTDCCILIASFPVDHSWHRASTKNVRLQSKLKRFLQIQACY